MMNHSGPAPGTTALVIGYGNSLRGDDAAGQCVAEAVAGWGLPGVEAVAVHHLTPELAESLAAAHLAVFVDAVAGAEGASPEVRRLEPAGDWPASGHTGDPRYLLALTRALYGSCPPAWWVLVPGADFAPGAGLSPAALEGLGAALQAVALLLGCRT